MSLSNSADHGPALLVIFWTFCLIALGVTSLRLLSRRIINALGWDDWTMVLTMVRKDYLDQQRIITYVAVFLSRSNNRDHYPGILWRLQACSIPNRDSIEGHPPVDSSCPSTYSFGPRLVKGLGRFASATLCWSHCRLAPIVSLRLHCLDVTTQRAPWYSHLCAM